MTNFARRTVFAGLAAAAMAFNGSGNAAQASEEQATAEMMGAMKFVFYHELGHGRIDVLDLPTVGREEDVVDEFATFMLLELGKSDNRNIEALFAGAESWRLKHATGNYGIFYGEHSFTLQRFYNIICFAYGSDPGRYYPLLEEFDIPYSRARRCESDYQTKSENWWQILGPHLASNENPPPADEGRFFVNYGSAESAQTQGVASIFQQSNFYESIIGVADNVFILPRDLEVMSVDCGMANAFWNGDAITMCHELGSDLKELFLAAYQPAQKQEESVETEEQPANGTLSLTDELSDGTPAALDQGTTNLSDMLSDGN